MVFDSPVELGPLHAAVRDQLLGRISPEQAAPAIFLLAHDVFDTEALQAGALIYMKAATRGAERLAQYLLAEAQLRASRAAAPSKSTTPTSVSQLQNRDLAAVLIDVGARIGLCARRGGGSFNDGVRAAQKEVEAAILRLHRGQPQVPA